IWSEQRTKIAGTISAQGGALGGDGGFIETSSHGELAIAPTAVITAAAPDGSGGTWLLDPANFVVDAGNAGVILAGLATGNVLIETTINAAAGTGEIDVNAPLLYASSHDLSLLAVGDIHINASIQNSQAVSGGAINLVAGWDGSTGVTPVGVLSGIGAPLATTVDLHAIQGTPGAFGNTALGGNLFI